MTGKPLSRKKLIRILLYAKSLARRAGGRRAGAFILFLEAGFEAKIRLAEEAAGYCAAQSAQAYAEGRAFFVTG